MATTQLVDIFNPLTFGGLAALAQLELNKFINAGVVVPDPQTRAQIAQGGNIGELTNYNPLTIDEPNYSNDDPGDNSVPGKIDSNKQGFRIASMNKSWSTMDISRELALQDPVGAITSKIGQYWATNNEKRIIQSSLGILADNVANDSGDMVVDVSNDSAGAIIDAERISAESVLDAKQTLGDHASMLTAMAMHSVIFTRLQKQNLITFIPNARGEIIIPTYLGYTVVVDDSMPAVMGANRIKYTIILFGMGVFIGESAKVATPSELEREASAGGGGGQDIIHSRRNDLFHPLGFDFTNTTVAGQSATQAELLLAVNWDRVWSRKHIPLAFLECND